MKRYFSKADTEILRVLINKELTEILGYDDIDIHAGNAVYTDNEIEFKLTVTRKGYDPMAESWKLLAKSYGLPVEALHKTVQDAHYAESKILGLMPKNRKYPVIIERDGKRYKMSIADIRRAKDGNACLLSNCGTSVKCLTDRPNSFYPDGPNGIERDHNRPY